MNNRYQVILSIALVSFLIMGAKPIARKTPDTHTAENTVPKKPLDLSLPITQLNKTDDTLNLEPEKTSEKPNVFAPKVKEQAIKLKGKLIMSPETEKRRSTVDGAGVTMDLKL